ncbi:MAG: VTT domain-containing protein [Chitinophagaceae bacterium]|nr:VTT domain-containing protein [Chitinophagaceae bacterium]
MLNFLDPMFLIQSVGLIGIFLIIFAETGLFFGFFFPGDSLLFTAGILASQGYLNIYYLLIGSFIMAVLGDTFGYYFGVKVGPVIFSRENSMFFKKAHVEKTKNFYNKYGNKTIVLARFVPIVRTFAPILAGVANMKYSKFLTFNIIGGFIWSVGVTLAGYILGNTLPSAEKYISIIIFVIVIVSVLPIISEVVNSRKK